MPTGYTCNIESGKIDNAKDFLVLCARAFGACVEMKEDSLDTPIPNEFKPDTEYYDKQINNANKRFEYLSTLTDENVKKQIDEEYEKNQVYCNKMIKEKNAKNERYIKVLNEVKNWNPPTTEHNGIKEFAINQIEMSLENPEYLEDSKRNKKPTVKEWKETALDCCLKDLDYNKKARQEEIERTNKRNKWLKDLRDSLKNM